MTGTSDSLSEDRRREVFAALVAAQDNGAGVAQSRAEVAARFGVTAEAVARIEQEGMDQEWPPL
jgi:hypothetical protein